MIHFLDVQCLELPPIPNGSIEYVALPAITNGSITYAPDNQYNLGTVATYDCDTGFVLDLSLGGSEMRTCVGDIGPDAEGLFDNQAPICVRKSFLWFNSHKLIQRKSRFSVSDLQNFLSFNNHVQVSFANLFSLTPMV